MTMGVALWLRWSWRDLRRRWLTVAAIASIIAIGTGVASGLGSTTVWRIRSNDASFELLRMHDLRLSLPVGTTAPQGALRAALDSTAHAGDVAAAVERLRVPTQVDASAAGKTVVVPGELVGTAVGRTGVDELYAYEGRALRPDDTRAAMVEANFARAYDLPAAGTLRLSAGREVRWVGLGTAPQELIVTGGGAGNFLSERRWATLYLPLEAAQDLAGQPGRVNELVVRLRAGADRGAVIRELRAAVADIGASGTITVREDEPAWRLLYSDARNDDRFWRVVYLLVLAGAAFATFNLVARIVEAQRRELGTGMALGAGPGTLARRPLLVAGEVALLGVVFGLGAGWLLGLGFSSLMATFAPLPRWVHPFQVGTFARSAALGFALPFLAALWPVARAVRMEPAAAIRTSHLGASPGLARAAEHLPVPGGPLARLPIRNLARTPRRTLLTALAIGAAITTLVAVGGMLDTIYRTIDDAETELIRRAGDRLDVALDGFVPATSPVVQTVEASPTVGAAEPYLRLPATLVRRGADIEVVVSFLPLDGTGMWSPTVSQATGRGGIVPAEKAARDLHVRAGDTVVVRHPVVRGGPVAMVDERLPVAGLHPNPVRAFAYLAPADAARFGLAGVVNTVAVRPAPGTDTGAVERALFGVGGVASVDPVGGTRQAFDDAMAQFRGFLQLAGGAVLVLALLIAVNTTTLAVDERAREHATMFAFGLPLRRVVAMAAEESLLTGLLGTAVGVAAGFVVTRWAMETLIAETLPEIGMHAVVGVGTVVAAVVLGVLAVAAAPLATVRRLRRMDIPSTLRVVE